MMGSGFSKGRPAPSYSCRIRISILCRLPWKIGDVTPIPRVACLVVNLAQYSMRLGNSEQIAHPFGGVERGFCRRVWKGCNDYGQP